MSATAAADMAEEFGYPVAVKAAHGGGGKGMRVVHRPEDLVGLEGAGREAEAYFGSAELYMERYSGASPLHRAQIVLFDDHGNGVFLGERDCTVQRRSPEAHRGDPVEHHRGEHPQGNWQRQRWRPDGHCGYVNAGTVEFLVDQESGEFFFLEMNTRLQVEHTITEMVTGIDLVKEQSACAQGEPLSFDAVRPGVTPWSSGSTPRTPGPTSPPVRGG